MMLNELVDKLTAIRDEHGDLPVFIWDCGSDSETTHFDVNYGEWPRVDLE